MNPEVSIAIVHYWDTRANCGGTAVAVNWRAIAKGVRNEVHLDMPQVTQRGMARRNALWYLLESRGDGREAA